MISFQNLLYFSIGVIAVVLIFTILNRLRLSRKPKIPPKKLEKVQAELLEAIKEASADQGTIVNISPFWRNRGVRVSQRDLVIQPLLADHHVRLHDPTTGNAFLDVLRDVYRTAFCLPSTKLILTDRTWVRMVHDRIPGKDIIIKRVDSMNIVKAGRDITNSPLTTAGRNARVETRSVAKNNRSEGTSGEGIPSEIVVRLIAALRFDAPQLPSKGHGGRFESLQIGWRKKSTGMIQTKTR
jgi:hypothetical protein